MAIKNVVKVMNFHSLLRVDKARKKAAMYFDTETELLKLIKKILFNKNIILDKKAITPKKDAPILDVYIGNDLGFCGDFNFSINKEVRKDNNYMIVIGKKIHTYDSSKVVLCLTKEEFFADFKKTEDIIYDAILNRKYSEINVIYNHYHNINSLEFTKKKLFPLDYDKAIDDGDTYEEDFAMETDLTPMLNNLISLYICYELKICEMNSFAAENVVRQQITKESLKKIDEMDEEKAKVTRKVKKQKDFQKIIENYRKG
jgi:F0F1-type ATP synthase gamma subunit